MNLKWPKWIEHHGALLSFSVSLAAAIFLSLYGTGYADPDRYFHLEVLRQMVEQGSLYHYTLPQFPWLGWDKNFIDKEYLYHIYLLPFYYFGEETGVIIGGFFLLSTTFYFIQLLSARFLTNRYFILFSPFLSLILYYWFIRLTYVRAFNLASLLALLMFYFATKSRWRWVGGMAALYSLSYHGLQTPIAIALVFDFASHRFKFKGWQFSLSVVVGLAVGALLHPSFPGNFFVGWNHLAIALQSGVLQGLYGLHFGGEVLPRSWQAYLFAVYPALFATAFHAFIAYFLWKKQKLEQAFPSVLLLSAVFLVLTKTNFRAIEYGYFFWTLSLGIVLQTLILRLPDKRAMAALSIACLLILSCIVQAGRSIHAEISARIDSYISIAESKLAAAETIPKQGGTKVFHCSWDSAPYLMYGRSDLQLIGVLDPTFLFLSSPKTHFTQTLLLKGKDINYRKTLRETFQSDYIFCRIPSDFRYHLLLDPHFEQIYPKAGEKAGYNTRVFRLVPKERPEIISQIESRKPMLVHKTEIENKPLTDFIRYEPLEKKHLNLSTIPDLLNSLYTESLPTGPPQIEPDENKHFCQYFRLAPKEIKRLAGADQLIIGFSDSIRLYRNQKMLFTTTKSPPAELEFRKRIKLSPKLNPKDKIEAIVCEPSTGDFLYFRSSVWKSAALKKICGSDNLSCFTIDK